MSGISEERLVKIDEEWLDTAQEVAEEAKNLGVQQASDRIILLAVAEIRRLREVIRKGNHCVDCGKLNPIDNVCDECLEAERTGHDQRAEDQASYNAGISAGLKGR